MLRASYTPTLAPAVSPPQRQLSSNSCAQHQSSGRRYCHHCQRGQKQKKPSSVVVITVMPAAVIATATDNNSVGSSNISIENDNSRTRAYDNSTDASNSKSQPPTSPMSTPTTTSTSIASSPIQALSTPRILGHHYPYPDSMYSASYACNAITNTPTSSLTDKGALSGCFTRPTVPADINNYNITYLYTGEPRQNTSARHHSQALFSSRRLPRGLQQQPLRAYLDTHTHTHTHTSLE